MFLFRFIKSFFKTKQQVWEECVYATAISRGLIVKKMEDRPGWQIIDPKGKRKTLEVYPK